MKEERRKKCGFCKQTKHKQEFSWKIKSKKLRSTKCKECVRDYNKQNYKNNRDKFLNKQIQRRVEITSIVWSFKASNPCFCCGESNPVCLEFDHINKKKTRKHSISYMQSKKMSLVKIIKEIKKCRILCANCLRIRTSQQLGWIVGNSCEL